MLAEGESPWVCFFFFFKEESSRVNQHDFIRLLQLNQLINSLFQTWQILLPKKPGTFCFLFFLQVFIYILFYFMDAPFYFIDRWLCEYDWSFSTREIEVFIVQQTSFKTVLDKMFKHKKMCFNKEYIFISFTFYTFNFIVSNVTKFYNGIKELSTTTLCLLNLWI